MNLSRDTSVSERRPSPYSRSPQSSPLSSSRSSPRSSGAMIAPYNEEQPTVADIMHRWDAARLSFSAGVPAWVLEFRRALRLRSDVLCSFEAVKYHEGKAKVWRVKVSLENESVDVYVKYNKKADAGKQEYLIGKKLIEHQVPGFSAPIAGFDALYGDGYETSGPAFFIAMRDFGSRTPPQVPIKVRELANAAFSLMNGLSTVSFDSSGPCQFLWGDSNLANVLWSQEHQKFFLIDYDRFWLRWTDANGARFVNSPRLETSSAGFSNGTPDVDSVKESIKVWLTDPRKEKPQVDDSGAKEKLITILKKRGITAKAVADELQQAFGNLIPTFNIDDYILPSMFKAT